jgi:lipoprotein signal peptidase
LPCHLISQLCRGYGSAFGFCEDYGVFIAFLAFIAYVVLINSWTGIDEAQRYFGFTSCFIILIFVYFEWFKEYPRR